MCVVSILVVSVVVQRENQWRGDQRTPTRDDEPALGACAVRMDRLLDWSRVHKGSSQSPFFFFFLEIKDVVGLCFDIATVLR